MTQVGVLRGQYWYGVAGPTGALGRAWDVDSKNDRFLMITMPGLAISAGGPAQPEIDVVVTGSRSSGNPCPSTNEDPAGALRAADLGA
jgi:hypothetical protein